MRKTAIILPKAYTPSNLAGVYAALDAVKGRDVAVDCRNAVEPYSEVLGVLAGLCRRAMRRQVVVTAVNVDNDLKELIDVSGLTYLLRV